MDSYLLDTCIFSALYKPAHPKYDDVRSAIGSIDPASPQTLSVIVLAELRFGLCLAEAAGQLLDHIKSTIEQAEERPLAKVGRHTSEAYGDVRARLATHWCDIRKRLPRWPEAWIDRISGETLQIDENDLWLVAQAVERNYVFLTTDEKLKERFEPAIPELRLQLI